MIFYRGYIIFYEGYFSLTNQIAVFVTSRIESKLLLRLWDSI